VEILSIVDSWSAEEFVAKRERWPEETKFPTVYLATGNFLKRFKKLVSSEVFSRKSISRNDVDLSGKSISRNDVDFLRFGTP